MKKRQFEEDWKEDSERNKGHFKKRNRSIKKLRPTKKRKYRKLNIEEEDYTFFHD